MSTKKTLFISLAVLALYIGATPAVAKKVLPRAKAQNTTKASGASVSGTVGVSAKFRGDRRAIIVNFSGLTNASNVNYTLSYNTRGTTQGAGGSINPGVTGNSASRELLFGTCSHGVCRYDSGITNARLIIVYTLKNGKRYSKTFIIKV